MENTTYRRGFFVVSLVSAMMVLAAFVITGNPFLLVLLLISGGFSLSMFLSRRRQPGGPG